MNEYLHHTIAHLAYQPYLLPGTALPSNIPSVGNARVAPHSDVHRPPLWYLLRPWTCHNHHTPFPHPSILLCATNFTVVSLAL